MIVSREIDSTEWYISQPARFGTLQKKNGRCYLCGVFCALETNVPYRTDHGDNFTLAQGVRK